MRKPNLLTEFKENLERFENGSFRHIYKMLFELLGDESLEAMLKDAFDNYKKGEKAWFAIFHKGIRQCDIFTGIHSYRLIDKLTDEQRKRRNELLAIRHSQWNQFKAEQPDEDYEKYKEFGRTPERVETLNELRGLNSIMRTEEYVSLGGILDSTLYNLISGDPSNELYHAMERTFKICK